MDEGRMSNRGYFTLRNAIPGYSFILIIIALNHFPLLVFLDVFNISEALGAFLGFFSALSGSAIGFLISQGWWWYWQGHAGILGQDEYQRTREAFRDVYGVNIPENNMRLRRVFVSAMDYADHTKIERDHKELLTLAERRWDMFHTLSSTLLSLGLGLVVGLIIRFYFLLCLVPTPYFSLAELISLELIIGGIVILICLIYRGRTWTLQMAASLTEAIVRRFPINFNELRRVFPELEFEDNS